MDWTYTDGLFLLPFFFAFLFAWAIFIFERCKYIPGLGHDIDFFFFFFFFFFTVDQF